MTGGHEQLDGAPLAGSGAGVGGGSRPVLGGILSEVKLSSALVSDVMLCEQGLVNLDPSHEWPVGRFRTPVN